MEKEDTVKTSVTTLFKNIGAVGASVIKTIFASIPSALGNLIRQSSSE